MNAGKFVFHACAWPAISPGASGVDLNPPASAFGQTGDVSQTESDAVAVVPAVINSASVYLIAGSALFNGSQYAGSPQAAYWIMTPSGSVTSFNLIPYGPASASGAIGISYVNNTICVAGNQVVNGVMQAVVWTPGKTTVLPGYGSSQALGMDAAGNVYGCGVAGGKTVAVFWPVH
jgi:hypothetical protein